MKLIRVGLTVISRVLLFGGMAVTVAGPVVLVARFFVEERAGYLPAVLLFGGALISVVGGAGLALFEDTEADQ